MRFYVDDTKDPQRVAREALLIAATARRVWPRQENVAGRHPPLDAAHQQVLLAFYVDVEATVARVARRLGVTSGYVRETFTRLREDGLVKDRTKPPRRTVIEVTDAGTAEAERIATILAARLRAENEWDEVNFAPDPDP